MLREVLYPWHPLRGVVVIVKSVHRRGDIGIFRCHLPGNERRDCFEVPAWMFDREVCSRMEVLPSPRPSLACLLDLKRLLNETRASANALLVQATTQLTKEQAHAETETRPSSGANAPLPSASPTTALDEHARPGPAGSRRAHRPAAGRSCSPTLPDPA